MSVRPTSCGGHQTGRLGEGGLEACPACSCVCGACCPTPPFSASYLPRSSSACRADLLAGTSGQQPTVPTATAVRWLAAPTAGATPRCTCWAARCCPASASWRRRARTAPGPSEWAAVETETCCCGCSIGVHVCALLCWGAQVLRHLFAGMYRTAHVLTQQAHFHWIMLACSLGVDRKGNPRKRHLRVVKAAVSGGSRGNHQVCVALWAAAVPPAVGC